MYFYDRLQTKNQHLLISTRKAKSTRNLSEYFVFVVTKTLPCVFTQNSNVTARKEEDHLDTEAWLGQIWRLNGIS